MDIQVCGILHRIDGRVEPEKIGLQYFEKRSACIGLVKQN